ncbi:unnamed protein product [Cuscuta campestris]|uniref:Reverse transcriptase Ty1/copia-type domain-containing protein n=2 Tax=Cuscuta campestris TaxID=132261 RepID=A0A484MTZ2_9ASTE|nr:unnamed protein product [Cuscuta campestris]
MSNSKKGSLPMTPGTVLSKSQSPSTPEQKELMMKVPYASAIGSIMYAMICTRPDVSFALSVTSRYQGSPGEAHWTAVKNILKYLRNTKDAFLVYGGEEELKVVGYTDASFQTDRDDSKSQAGYLFCLNGGAFKMPKYAKFLKELLANKKPRFDPVVANLSAECSAVLTKNLPKKQKDPGSFTIPCSIDNVAFNNALADLGASINLVPSYVAQKLVIKELLPTRMCIQLADISVTYPLEIANQEHVSCNLVNAIDALDDFWFGTSSVEDGPRDEGIISMANSAEEKYVELMELCDKVLHEEENAEQVLGVQAEEDEEEEESEPEPTPELKPLPSHLEYAFLDEEEKCPVIIASDLTEEQKGKLIDILKLYGHVIARRLEDLKGTSPTFCTHKIFIEEGKRPMAQQPRMLNPNLRKVVKKEIMKLLDADPKSFQSHKSS